MCSPVRALFTTLDTARHPEGGKAAHHQRHCTLRDHLPSVVILENLDQQLSKAKTATEVPQIPKHLWTCLATTIHNEIASLDEVTANTLRVSIPIPPERYVEEMLAFQSWMDFGRANGNNPVVVRAQVMTELYVAFVWLRDSLVKPCIDHLAEDATLTEIERFFSNGRPRKLRNAIAHGHWYYLPNYDGLEFWAEPSRGAPHERIEISQPDLDAWQTLSRGTTIAILLALTAS